MINYHLVPQLRSCNVTQGKLTSPYKTRIPATGSRNHSAVPGSHIDLDSQIGKCCCTCPKYVCTAGNGCQTTAVLLKMVCHTSPNATRQGDPRAAMRCGVGCSSERSRHVHQICRRCAVIGVPTVATGTCTLPGLPTLLYRLVYLPVRLSSTKNAACLISSRDKGHPKCIRRVPWTWVSWTAISC